MAEEILKTETGAAQQEIAEASDKAMGLAGEADVEGEISPQQSGEPETLQQGGEPEIIETSEDGEDILEGKYPHDEENRNKKMRNKAPAFIFDYWKTNRDTERENMRRQEEEGTAGKPWSRNEKIYLAVIVICVVLLAVKYGPAILEKLG